MSREVKIKVASKSFSKHFVLREELCEAFPNTEFNEGLVDFTADNFAEFVDDSSGVVVGLEPIVGSVLARCPNLEFASKFGVG